VSCPFRFRHLQASDPPISTIATHTPATASTTNSWIVSAKLISAKPISPKKLSAKPITAAPQNTGRAEPKAILAGLL
jgi:hypothetical protein